MFAKIWNESWFKIEVLTAAEQNELKRLHLETWKIYTRSLTKIENYKIESLHK